MRIGGFVDMSTIDWHGNVSLVVFFAGCNFRCPYCQNSSPVSYTHLTLPTILLV